MKAKKTAVLLALLIGLSAVFGACTPLNIEESAVGDADGKTTDETGPPKLVMATDASFAPYEYLNGQDIVGIDIDIARKIAEKTGYSLEIRQMGFDEIVPAVQNGTAGIGMAALTASETWLASVSFTIPYVVGKQAIIVPSESDISSPADLTGKKLGVVENTAGETYCVEQFGEAPISRFATGAEAVQALISGGVDAVVTDRAPAVELDLENTGVELLDTLYRTDSYAIAVNKNNSSLLKLINSAIAELEASGEIQTIVSQYIKAE